MSRSKVEGTKIAQAAKDLNVTSVTIRRYIQEFNIETATDENGIKVLPKRALKELQEIRKLKEDGLTNPKVMEVLEEMRAKSDDDEKEKPESKKRAIKTTAKAAPKSKAKKAEVEDDEDEEEEVVEEEKPRTISSRAKGKPARAVKSKAQKDEDEEDSEAEVETEEVEKTSVGEDSESDSDGEEKGKEEGGEGSGEGSGKVMHTLTCQTCSKNFEHINPRLRDCLECYRTKRKERRRGGDKHKNVIQNPVAQQVVSKSQPSREVRENGARENGQRDNGGREGGNQNERHFDRLPDRTQTVERVSAVAAPRIDQPSAWAQLQKPVRSYRKAIEETRLITGSLKRRLERPDLPEGERRWLEQIYAYQLILHQGWRHLAEYKSGSTGQGKPQED